MPKEAKELKPLAVSRIADDGLHAVGGAPGLYLKIDGNSRSWILYATIDGARRKMGLGSCESVSLAEARDKAREMQRKIKAGQNPIEERKAEKARAELEATRNKTFRECAEMFIEAKRIEWVKKHALRYANSLAIHVYPIIGKLPVADIEIDDVLDVLQQPIKTTDGVKQFWEAKTDTASRVRNRIERVLQYAKALKFRTGDNPADWETLKNTLPSKNKISKEENYPALPFTEIGAFMAELRKRDGMAPRALEFAILTAARSGTVRSATWEEIDLAARVWNAPADHMKKKKPLMIPLSDDAVRLLEALPRYAGNNHIFPPVQAAELSDMALLMVVRRMHEKKKLADGLGWIDTNMDNRQITVHGFRSTFKDWAEETTAYPPKAIEFALAHKLPNKVEGSYQRMTLFDKRIPLMADWARYCDTVQTAMKNNVIPMRRAV